jgi:hypothetical protein
MLHKSVNILNKKNIKLLIKDGFSYGKYLDNNIAKYQPTTISSLTTNHNMLNMIKNKRADYMLISYEEAYNLFQTDITLEKNMKIRYLTDIPKGNKRYLMCSQKVPDSFINKINKFLK